MALLTSPGFLMSSHCQTPSWLFCLSPFMCKARWESPASAWGAGPRRIESVRDQAALLPGVAPASHLWCARCQTWSYILEGIP